MHRMAGPRRYTECRSALVGSCLAVCLSLGQGCDRSETLRPEDANAPGGSKQELPFHPGPEPASTAESAGLAAPHDATLSAALPFKTGSSSRIVPAGTLLTVQLEGSLSSAKVRAGDMFSAVVSAPLMIDGDILIPRGTEVTGRVESEQSQPGRPGLVPGSGYFRLTLSTISVDGRPIELQTSSLFARGTILPSGTSYRGNPSHPQSENVRVRKGRPLTFRLTAPVTLADANATAKGQYPARNTN